MRKKYSPFTATAATVFTACCLFSCTQGYFDLEGSKNPEWNPHVAVPLINSELTTNDILNTVDTGGIVREDSTGFLTVVYEGQLSSITAGQLIPIPDQFTNESFQVTAGEIATLQGTGTVSLAKTITYVYQLTGNEEIDSIVLKSSMLNLQIVSDFRHNGNLVVSIPRLKLNGIPFSRTIPILYPGFTPVAVARSFNLAGYTIDLTQGGTTFNTVDIDLQLNLVNSGNPVSPGEAAGISLSFVNNRFSSIFGYLGQHILNFNQDSVEMEMFKNTIDGTLWFEDPEINLYIRNSYGTEISGTFNVLDAWHETKGTLPIGGPGLPNPLVINYPDLTEIGQSKTTVLSLDKTGTNVRDVIALLPHYIIHQIDASVNPGGKTNYNFVLDTSTVDVDFEVVLPLHGTATGFTVTDTVDFTAGDISGEDSSVTIETLLFKIMISNGFPTDVGVQLYLTDSLYNVTDSLIEPYEIIIRSGTLNAEGKVISRTQTTKFVSFSKERIDRLTDARYIIIRGVLETANAGSTLVKFYSGYGLGVRLGAQAKLKVDTNP